MFFKMSFKLITALKLLSILLVMCNSLDSLYVYLIFLYTSEAGTEVLQTSVQRDKFYLCTVMFC